MNTESFSAEINVVFFYDVRTSSHRDGAKRGVDDFVGGWFPSCGACPRPVPWGKIRILLIGP